MNKEILKKLLENASQAHEDYEAGILNGVYDNNWSSWYAAFVVGSLGLENVKPAQLTKLLVEAQKIYKQEYSEQNWVDFYADYIIDNI